MALLRFLSLLAAMFIATLMMGSLPLLSSLSPWRMSAFASFGSGLLLGAAMAVVLPEGIAACYESADGDQSHVVAYAISLGFALMFVLDSVISWTEERDDGEAHSPGQHPQSNGYFFDREGEDSSSRPSHDLERAPSPTSTPMLATPLLKRHFRRDRLPSTRDPRKTTLSTVIGLLVHSLADGLSLGASSAFAAHGGSSLDFVVFLAILIHKAPAAFGLSSILLQAKAPRPYVRRIIVLFAAAAPLGGIFTFAVIRLFATDSRHLHYLTGVALSLSAGTFLFVATHVLSESEDPLPASSGESLGKRSRTVFVLAGLALPGLTSALIQHEH